MKWEFDIFVTQVEKWFVTILDSNLSQISIVFVEKMSCNSFFKYLTANSLSKEHS